MLDAVDDDVRDVDPERDVLEVGVDLDAVVATQLVRRAAPTALRVLAVDEQAGAEEQRDLQLEALILKSGGSVCSGTTCSPIQRDKGFQHRVAGWPLT
ncbi:MAG: hypothetical protein QM621_05895 [Aeromicrobium sp.]|uniref:hypothetical protein n=1 Tax=Aeromicrobium sp. TaxID=1871063 RepID=UPI0039E65C8C